MKRRTFIRNTGVALAGVNTITPFLKHLFRYKDQIIGHNQFQYKIDLAWGELNSSLYPVKDCHEMVQDSMGRIILLTNHTKNNVIIYDKSGKLLETWGTQYPGAHGLTLKKEGGEDFLYIADNNLHEVIKTTIEGKEVLRIPYPMESGKYASADQFIPTETCIADNGDIYVVDGYGLQYVLHYNSKGEMLNVFGGRGDEESNFGNAHGICIDQRKEKDPILLITDRMNNKLKRFELNGQYLSTIDLPGAYICRPVIHGSEVYLATIWSGAGASETGFISILDENDRLISAPGGCNPMYENGMLNRMHQAIKVFIHPHDVCIDEDENLYVAQWNSGQTYPIKLVRV